MKLIKQPYKHSCGQTCVAMILDRDVDSICRRLRNDGATYFEQLIPIFKEAGYEVSPEYKFGVAPLPPLAILRMKMFEVDGQIKPHGHLAVWNYGVIYDPTFGLQPNYPPTAVFDWYREIHRVL